MNLKNLFQFKKITVPENNGTKEVETVQLWSVRWLSRKGEYSGDLRDECEFFTSEQEAEEFQTALQNAYKLLRHTSGTSVILTKE